VVYISRVFKYILEGLEGLATISATRKSRSLRKYLLYIMMTRATEFVWYFAIKPTGDKEDAYRHLGLVWRRESLWDKAGPLRLRPSPLSRW